MNTPLELIDAYLDDVCTPEEFSELVLWLKESPEHVSEFAERSYLHREISEALVHSAMSALSGVRDEWEVLQPESSSPVSNFMSLVEALKDPSPNKTRLNDITYMLDAEQELIRHLADRNKPVAKIERDGPLVVVIPKAMIYLAAAAVIALLVTAVVHFLPEKQAAPAPVVAQVEPQPVKNPAILIGQDAAVWADGQPLLASTEFVEGQSLDLRSGVVELSFDRGAVVTLEGPCQVQILNDNSIRLRSGRIVALAGGTAQYFSVHTPSAEIVDFGTQFGVQVAPDRGTKVAVFDGLVSLQSSREKQTDSLDIDRPLMISEGKMASVDREGTVSETTSTLTESDRVTFARSLEEYRSPEFQYQRAVMTSAPLAYWRFESDDASRVQNEVSPGTNDLVGEGLVGIDEEGAFGKAASFKAAVAPYSHFITEGKLAFSPNTYEYTIECLFNSDFEQYAALVSMFEEGHAISSRVFGGYASLGMTDSRLAAPENIAGWRALSLRGMHREQVGLRSARADVFENEQYPIGQWQHVALVKSQGKLSLYVNGSLVGSMESTSTAIIPSLRAVIGISGSWDDEAGLYANLPFTGKIDEVAIYNRALKPDEIALRQEIWSLQTTEELR